MQQPKTDSDVIIDGLMPSVWATYKQSLRSSVVGFARAMFNYSGASPEGGRVSQLGMIPIIAIESVSIPVSSIKIVLATLVVVVATTMFLASPVINLVMLPFYRRKSIRELRIFIDKQAADLAEQRRKVGETLSGAV